MVIYPLVYKYPNEPPYSKNNSIVNLKDFILSNRRLDNSKNYTTYEMCIITKTNKILLISRDFVELYGFTKKPLDLSFYNKLVEYYSMISYKNFNNYEYLRKELFTKKLFNKNWYILFDEATKKYYIHTINGTLIYNSVPLTINKNEIDVGVWWMKYLWEFIMELLITNYERKTNPHMSRSNSNITQKTQKENYND